MWTPAFTVNRDRRLFWLKVLAKLKGEKIDSKYLQRLAKKAGVVTLLREINKDQAVQGIKLANATCAAYAKMHIQERERFIDSWADAEVEALNITKEAAIKQWNMHKRQQQDGRIIGRALGKLGHAGVSKVLVDSPNGLHECSTKQETEEAFLSKSNTRFVKPAIHRLLLPCSMTWEH